MMRVIKDIQEWKDIRRELQGQSIGFVPTMGNLHAGHVSLIARSVRENAVTVCSIFINPTQFNRPDDLANYPKTLEEDMALMEAEKVAYLLLFTEAALYPDGYQYRVTEHSEYGQSMEGAHRPGHFTGMLTIVLKLLLLTGPRKAYFGEKDYQQWVLVKKMAEAFLLESEIVPCATIRNPDGLPFSSRNQRLSADDLTKAAQFSRLLASHQTDQDIAKQLEAAGFIVEYIAQHGEQHGSLRQDRRYGAVRLGGVRLIDNWANPIECEPDIREGLKVTP